MPLDVNAKAFVPNYGAKPFVPGASFTPQAPPPPPPQRTSYFRYSLHTPSSTYTAVSTTENEQAPVAPPFSIASMQTKGCLRSTAAGGPTFEALLEFANTYFTNLERQQAPDVTRIGFLTATELLNSTSHVLDSAPGLLLPLIVPCQPAAENYRNMNTAFQALATQLQNNSDVRGLGHISRTWKQDEGAPVTAHYFFVALSSEEGYRLASTLFDSITVARQVIRVTNLMAHVLDAKRTVATLNLLNGESPQISPVFRPSPGFALKVVNVPNTVEALADMNSALEETLSLKVDKPRYLVLAISCSTETTTADFLRLVIRCCWDFMIVPVAVCIDEEHFGKYLSTNSTPVQWHNASPVIAAAHCFASRAVKSDTECITLMKHLGNNVGDGIGNVVKHNDMTSVVPTRSRSGCPFNAPCFSPVEDLNSYLAVRDLVGQALPNVETGANASGDTNKTMRLRKSVLKDAATNIAREAYRLRRNAVGERVLVVIDALQNIFLVDSATQKWIAALPTWRGTSASPLVWSGQLTGANCVLEGTLVSSFRGENQFKVIVHDVVIWNDESLANQTLPQRMQEIDHPGLECETGWPASSPLGIVILRVAYTPVNKGPNLMSGIMAHSEHPTLGITFVPCTVTKKKDNTSLSCVPTVPNDRLMAYTWIPAESQTLNFVVLTDEEVQEDMGNLPYKVRRVTLGCRKGSLEGAGAESDIIPYRGEYADYLVSTVPNVSKSTTVQCLLQREADGAHWWEIIRAFNNAEHVTAHTHTFVDSIVHDPVPTTDEMTWLCTVSEFLCKECNEVDDQGANDTTVGKYYCRKCWESYGYGECKQCGAAFTQGSLDQATGSFYCKGCWAGFHAAPSTAATTNGKDEHGLAIDVPASPTAASPTHSVGNAIALSQSRLIRAAARAGSVKEVLEMCCGSALTIRRWVEIGTTAYLGVDLTTSVLAEAAERTSYLTAQLQQARQGRPYALPKMEFICANCFHPDFWTLHVAKAHAAQFNVICSRKGLNAQVEDSLPEIQAEATLKGIGNALVPNGLFLGFLVDRNAVAEFMMRNERSQRYECDVFNIELVRLEGQAHAHYNVRIEGDTFSWGAVDILGVLSIATKYDLSLVPGELVKGNPPMPPTVLDFLTANEPEYTQMQLTPREKSLLQLYRIVMLRKGAVTAPPSEPTNHFVAAQQGSQPMPL